MNNNTKESNNNTSNLLLNTQSSDFLKYTFLSLSDIQRSIDIILPILLLRKQIQRVQTI